MFVIAGQMGGKSGSSRGKDSCGDFLVIFIANTNAWPFIVRRSVRSNSIKPKIGIGMQTGPLFPLLYISYGRA
jgi:hypothetical protein